MNATLPEYPDVPVTPTSVARRVNLKSMQKFSGALPNAALIMSTTGLRYVSPLGSIDLSNSFQERVAGSNPADSGTISRCVTVDRSKKRPVIASREKGAFDRRSKTRPLVSQSDFNASLKELASLMRYRRIRPMLQSNRSCLNSAADVGSNALLESFSQPVLLHRL